jgi:hypothetical protein
MSGAPNEEARVTRYFKGDLTLVEAVRQAVRQTSPSRPTLAAGMVSGTETGNTATVPPSAPPPLASVIDDWIKLIAARLRRK